MTPQRYQRDLFQGGVDFQSRSRLLGEQQAFDQCCLWENFTLSKCLF